MKRILLAATLLAFSLPSAFAQDAKPAAQTISTDAKREFASKVSELEVSIDRKATQTTQQLYLELSRLMHKHINDTHALLGDAPEGQKADLKNKIERMNTLMGETKRLFGEAEKKKAEFIGKMREFQKAL
jgi:hypothetical protein